MIKKILLGTKNKGKIGELKLLLESYDIEVLTLDNFDIEEPEETGKTFRENAALKAIYYFEKTGITTLSDDSGLVIPVLDGQPGVYSHDWAGPNDDYEIAFQRIYTLLREKGAVCPETYLETCLALATSEKDVRFFEGRIYGIIAEKPDGPRVFGYDPIFIIKSELERKDGPPRTFANMTREEKNKISHRAKALHQFLDETFKRKEA